MQGRKIRVLHIVPTLGGYGAEHMIVELLRVLSSPSIDAALLTIYEPTPEELAGLPFRVLHAGRKSRGDRFFLGRLVKQIRAFAPDIVHTHTRGGKYWGRAAARLAGVSQIVYTEHNPCDVRRTWLERAGDLVLHPITKCVVTFFAEQGTALGQREHVPEKKLVIIPNGLPDGEAAVDADRAETRKALALEDTQFAIFVIARLHFQKNQVLVLRSLAEMREADRERAIVFFVGSGEDEGLLRSLARDLSVDDRVRFLGYRRDVPVLLAAADAILMTSWFEGMPISLLEAMIAGVPIVTTPWVGARNMLADGEYGFLTTGYEAAHVAREIERVMNDPGARREIATRAQRFVHEEYAIERMADAHRALYERLTGVAS